MDDRELTKKLEQAEPPQIALPDAKTRLRRELLTSPDFEARASHQRRFGFLRYAFAGLATVTVIGIFAMQLIPKRSSAEALLGAMGSAYDSRVDPDAIHYLHQTLSFPGDKNFEVESWVFPGEAKFRARIKDAKSGQTLAHTIIESGRVYSLQDSPVQLFGGVKRITVLTGEDSSHSGEGSSDAEDDFARHAKHNMTTVVINRLNENDDWNDETMVRALIISEFFSQTQVTGGSPRDLVRDLETGSEVTYAGVSYDPQSQDEVELLERRNSGALPFSLEFRLKHMEEAQRFIGLVMSGSIPVEAGTDYSEILREHELTDAVTIRPIESVETIQVLSETSQIKRMTLSILEDGVETYRADKTYLEDRYLPYTPDTFDPELHDLTLVTETQTKVKRIKGSDK